MRKKNRLKKKFKYFQSQKNLISILRCVTTFNFFKNVKLIKEKNSKLR